MKRRKDYQNKSFNNPCFSRKKQKKHPGLKFLGLIFFIALIFVLYYLNTAEQFQIKNIEISGNENIKEQGISDVMNEQLDKRRFLFFSQKSIFFFSKNKAEKELSRNYFFEDLKITKNYFDAIKVAVKEKTTSMVWAAGDDKYHLYSDGKVIRKVESSDFTITHGQGDVDIIRSEINSSIYPLVYDQSNAPVVIGQQVVSKPSLDFIVMLNEEFNSGADFDVSYYQVADPGFKDLTLFTKEGWQAWFRIDDSAREQAQLLFMVLEQKVQDRRSLQYIDLRFGEKIFYQ